MGIINILPGEISNKIAAGEVVERPASVIKELVENSIDAGAATITVEISKGGSTYMRVTDNGGGMSDDDAKICFLRHATSKITTEDDLDAIYTLGFRGEALSSIGAVSKITLYTRQDNSSGICVKCEGGEIISCEGTGLQRGTTIIVERLFFNTPARAKFLKKDATEAGYITDIMSRFILAHPEISFRLIVNGKEKLFSPGDGSLENAVFTVYGRDYARNLIPVNYESDGVKVSGVIGNSNVSRPNRTYESFFVNKRYIKSLRLMGALEEAFKNQIMIGKFPMAALNIEINPLLIDINVHPTKLEVKFSDDRIVSGAVYYAVKNALYAIPEEKQPPEKADNFLGIPADMIKRPETKAFNPRENPFLKKYDDKRNSKAELHIENGADTSDNGDAKISESKAQQKNAFTAYSGDTNLDPPTLKEKFKSVLVEKNNQEVADLTAETASEKRVAPPIKNEILEVLAKTDKEKDDEEGFISEDSVILQYKSKPQSEPIQITDTDEATAEDEEILEDFKVIGQIFDTYIIVQKGNDMLLIDQHAAHERLKYEELLSELEDKGVYSQMLIVPVEIRLSGTEYSAYEDVKGELVRLGFECSERDGTVFVSSAPADVDWSEVEELVIELLTHFDEGKKELISETRQRLLYTVACKAAIKANHRLSIAEMESLVRRVFALEKISTCPHGRPITISKTKKEIEKDFKRII